MNPSSRIGDTNADIVVIAKGGRDFRFERMLRGQETPREFFYGFFDLERAGLSAAMLSSSGAVPGLLGSVVDRLERGFSSLTMLGVRPFSARLSRKYFGSAKVAISFTDGFSLSLGLGLSRCRGRPILIGGFHGLSDIEERAPASAKSLVRKLITRSLAGLDHAFFFGPGDRRIAIEQYGLTPERSSIFPFGVDTEYWRPLPEEPKGDFFISAGQDPNRDYNLLAAAPGSHPIRIVTRREVKVPVGADHIQIMPGDFFGSDSMTDNDLRRAYNSACAVIVPLKDVNQPTGYSVTLQAMSCGRPVIVTNIRGLWPHMRDGRNCLLVPPGDGEALAAAIGRVRTDVQLAHALGKAARDTICADYRLANSGNGTIALARRGLLLWQERAGHSGTA